MTDKPAKWRVSLTGTGVGGRGGVEIAVDMMKILWTSHHDRHGTDQVRPRMSAAEAEAAVHLAITLVH